MASNRPRVTFDVPERTRRALAIFAASKGLSISEAIEWMVERLLSDYLAAADREIASGELPASKRGRPCKPKPPD